MQSRNYYLHNAMNSTNKLLDQFIGAVSQINTVVVPVGNTFQVSPHVLIAIFCAKKLLPLVDDYATKNHVVGILHDIYKELRQDIKVRGMVVNGKKHPALETSLQAYRIIIS